MYRYSKNRQALLCYLANTKTHPTAEWVYERLKAENPRLSLATVYRNLVRLESDGAIRSIGTVNGQERFDGDTSPHAHVICTDCGKVDDVDGVSLPDPDPACVAGYEISRAEVRFYGVCADCARKEQSNAAKAEK